MLNQGAAEFSQLPNQGSGRNWSQSSNAQLATNIENLSRMVDFL
jgi:hypothetical protein